MSERTEILIVEDDAIVASIYQRRLKMDGFLVQHAADGALAMEMITRDPPDIILLDLQLPKVSGIEVLKFIRAREESKNMPVVVFTNAFQGALVEAAWQAGANECLTKAICTPKQVSDTLRSTLAAALAHSVTQPVPAAINPSVSEPTKMRDYGPPAKDGIPTGENIDPSKHAALEVEQKFQHELRRGFAETLPQSIGLLRRGLQSFLKNDNDPANLHWVDERKSMLFDMYRKTHSLSSGAGVAGCPLIAQFTSASGAFLAELYENPKSITPSSIRTLAHAVDCLAHLATDVDAAETIKLGDTSVLVVDDEALSRKSIMRGLEKAGLKAMEVPFPVAAFELCKRQPFDLIFLDIDMPGMNGYDLCKQIRSQPQHAKTPVIFVTGLTDFGSRAMSTISGGTDLIGKPFPTIELSVKALTFLMRSQFTPGPKPA